MSQHIASSSPPPRQKPWIAATNGVWAASIRSPSFWIRAPSRSPGLRGSRAERRELGDVGARYERLLARAFEDDRAHSFVRVEAVELGLELLEQRSRERVHGWMVDRDDARPRRPVRWR